MDNRTILLFGYNVHVYNCLRHTATCLRQAEISILALREVTSISWTQMCSNSLMAIPALMHQLLSNLRLQCTGCKQTWLCGHHLLYFSWVLKLLPVAEQIREHEGMCSCQHMHDKCSGMSGQTYQPRQKFVKLIRRVRQTPNIFIFRNNDDILQQHPPIRDNTNSCTQQNWLGRISKRQKSHPKVSYALTPTQFHFQRDPRQQ